MKPKSLPKLPQNISTSIPALPKVPCPQLSKLPKSPRQRGVTYRGLTPGNATKIIAPRAYDLRPFVDPSHPAVQRTGKGASSLVNWHSPSEAFRIIAGPKALLLSPDTKVGPGYSGGTMFERWDEKLERMKMEEVMRNEAGSSTGAGVVESEWPISPSRHGKTKAIEATNVTDGLMKDAGVALSPAMRRWLARRKGVLSKAVPMSIQFANSKAKMGGKVFYAFASKKRVRAAISLIVNQGAKVVEVQGEEATPGEGGSDIVKKEIVFDLEEVEKMKEGGWVMKDWTYVVMPTMRLYRIPFIELIPEVREALQFIKAKATGIEESWLRPPKPFEPPKYRGDRPGGKSFRSSDHAKIRR